MGHLTFFLTFFSIWQPFCARILHNLRRVWPESRECLTLCHLAEHIEVAVLCVFCCCVMLRCCAPCSVCCALCVWFASLVGVLADLKTFTRQVGNKLINSWICPWTQDNPRSDCIRYRSQRPLEMSGNHHKSVIPSSGLSRPSGGRLEGHLGQAHWLLDVPEGRAGREVIGTFATD